MSANLLNGKKIGKEIRKQLKLEVAELTAAGIVPGLDVILVGDDPASGIYVRSKARRSKKIGMRSATHLLPEQTSQEELLALVDKLNRDPECDGILVQLPLPKHIDSQLVLHSIDPAKDVDGFHPENVGKLVTGQPRFVPCTPLGMIAMLEHHDLPIKGKRAVVIGRSNIVGKPIAMLLLHRHATVTICHSRTEDLRGVAREADILVAAVGRPEIVRGDWVKEGAIVLDVGINRLDDGRLVGDVAFEEASERASWITPVPGGVGPMTITMLLSNTVRSAQMRRA